MIKLFKKRVKVAKEPSLLRQIISVYYEQAKRRKALRLLEKQNWSMDFLAGVLIKAAKNNERLSLVIEDPVGRKITLTTKEAAARFENIDDSIFNHLDDEIAIQRFVREHNTRK